MKKFKFLPFLILPLLFITASSFHSGLRTSENARLSQDISNSYKDGSYEGMSRASYKSEPFWGKVRVVIRNGSISKVSFMIRDSSIHETFNKKYKKHFEGNPIYLEQCRKDWGGVKKYPKKLMKTGDPDKVDVISGATWSYKIFKASLKEALTRAGR